MCGRSPIPRLPRLRRRAILDTSRAIRYFFSPNALRTTAQGKTFTAKSFVAASRSSKSLADENPQEGLFRPEWESLQKYEVPEWYKDAKFGIFIHWGLYSVPAFVNEWYPRNRSEERRVGKEHSAGT